jgi:hypothetical protein
LCVHDENGRDGVGGRHVSERWGSNGPLYGHGRLDRDNRLDLDECPRLHLQLLLHVLSINCQGGYHRRSLPALSVRPRKTTHGNDPGTTVHPPGAPGTVRCRVGAPSFRREPQRGRGPRERMKTTPC